MENTYTNLNTMPAPTEDALVLFLLDVKKMVDTLKILPAQQTRLNNYNEADNLDYLLAISG